MRRTPRRGFWARIGRLIGDASLTIGMSEAFHGPSADREAIYNVMVFGEGDAMRRNANRDKDADS